MTSTKLAPTESITDQGTATTEDVGAHGKVTVVFAEFDVVDHHGDLTERGAFGNQTVHISGWNHGLWETNALPLGVARIYETHKDARADLQFNMQLQAARDLFEAIRFDMANGKLTQYSYGFDVENHSPGDGEQCRRILKKVLVHEISPVTVAAGIGTHTVSAKSELEDIRAHVERQELAEILRSLYLEDEAA
ncbi:HK97 family phage prohead protease [Actinomadura sp. 6N118]|uniref:HK97 family phage prohead protease n=1 Tax=Actinomadura sp. 6N118 TaxID=3375151 RepID=UPI00379904A6